MQIDADIVDIAVTPDFTKAVVTSSDSKKLFLINLEEQTPFIENTINVPTPLADVDITPDGRFAVSVGGSSDMPLNMVSYGFSNQLTGIVPADAQAVAISPNWNGRMLTVRYDEGRVRLYLLDGNGRITDTGSESLINGTPINITYYKDGNFAFVADYTGNQVVVLDTSNPNYYGEASRSTVGTHPQTILMSKLFSRPYVLTDTHVEAYSFSPLSKRLTEFYTFKHNLSISNYVGVDQMAFDSESRKLFILGQNELAVFDTSYTTPLFLGTVGGLEPDGGLAVGKKRCRLPLNTMAVTNQTGVWYINPDTFNVIAQTIITTPAIGIAVLNSGSRAFVTSGTLFTDIDLKACPPEDIRQVGVSTGFRFEDVAITPDDHFAVTVNTNFPGGNYFFVYDLRNLGGSKFVPNSGGEVAVAISPKDNGYMLAARYYAGRVRLYVINGEGNIADTEKESDVKGSPINLAYSPDGNFVFVANYLEDEVVVLDTSNPNYFGEASRIGVVGSPQTIIVSGDGTKVYVLTTQRVEIYNFDPVAKRLTLAGNFQHGVTIAAAFGIEQMAVDTAGTKFFILTTTGIAVFAVSGQLLGTLDVPNGKSIVPYKY
jgi:DNA-binding beta-propeller fold protein YncE